MFAGNEQMITVKIPENLAGAFIDQFGKNILISEDEDNKLKVVFHAVDSRILLGWILGLGDVEIIGPQSVRDKIIDMLEKNKKFY